MTPASSGGSSSMRRELVLSPAVLFVAAAVVLSLVASTFRALGALTLVVVCEMGPA